LIVGETVTVLLFAFELLFEFEGAFTLTFVLTGFTEIVGDMTGAMVVLYVPPPVPVPPLFGQFPVQSLPPPVFVSAKAGTDISAKMAAAKIVRFIMVRLSHFGTSFRSASHGIVTSSKERAS